MKNSQKFLLANMQKRLEYCKQLYNKGTLDPEKIQYTMQYILEWLDISTILCLQCLETKDINKAFIHSIAFALYCKDRKEIDYTKLTLKKDYKESLRNYIFATAHDIKVDRNKFDKIGYDFCFLGINTPLEEIMFHLGHLQTLQTRLVWCCLAYLDILPKTDTISYNITLFQTQIKVKIEDVLITINEELKTIKLQKGNKK